MERTCWAYGLGYRRNQASVTTGQGYLNISIGVKGGGLIGVGLGVNFHRRCGGEQSAQCMVSGDQLAP